MKRKRLVKILSAACAAAMVMSSGAPVYAKTAKVQNAVTLTADQDMKKKTIKKGQSFTLKIKTISKGDKVNWFNPSAEVIRLSRETKKTVKVTGLKAGSSYFNYAVNDSSGCATIHKFTVKVTDAKKAKKRMAKAVGKKKKAKRKKIAKTKAKGKKVKRELNYKKKTLVVGQSFTLKIKGAKMGLWTYDGKKNHNIVKFKDESTAPSVKITAKKLGKITIVWAELGDGEDGFYKCRITVKAKPHKHNWVPVYRTVHHDEVSHYETKTVQEPFTLVTDGYVPNGSVEAVQKCLTEHPDCYIDYGYVADGKGGYRARTYYEYYDALETDQELEKQYYNFIENWSGCYTDVGNTITVELEENPDNPGLAPAIKNLYRNVFTKHLTRTVTKKVKVVDKAAYDEKVVDYYKCTVYGETKNK